MTQETGLRGPQKTTYSRRGVLRGDETIGSSAPGSANSETANRVNHMDEGQARAALKTQYHRVRLLSLGVGGLILFIALMLVNVHSPANPVDQAIWDAFIDIRAGWLNRPVEIFTSGFSALPDMCYSIVAIVAIGLWRKSWWPAVTIGLSMILAPAAMVLVKNIIDRTRPPLIDRLVSETSFSFPSGHATGVAALVVSVYLAMHAVLSRTARRVVGMLLAVLAIAVACSRLYVAVHWGTDVLGGLTLGTTVTCLVYAVFPKILLPLR